MPMPALDVTCETGICDAITVDLMGDISLNGCFCDPAYHAGLTECMRRAASTLGRADLRVVNWESPLWGDGGVNELKMPRLSTTRETAECMLPLEMDVALLGNNHAYDCLEAGYVNTVRFLSENNIATLGAGLDDGYAEPVIMERCGSRIGLLSYVSGDTNPNLPDNTGLKLNFLDENRAIDETRRLREQTDYVIVSLHWGAEEIIKVPTTAQRTFARRLAEAGGTIIACSHSHCLQGYEFWKGSAILYGLGNFLFHDFGGRPGREWPELCRNAGVFRCSLADGEVRDVAVSYFRQTGTMLVDDTRPSRGKNMSRLCALVRRNDRGLARAYKLGLWRKRYWDIPLRYIRESGGVIGAMRHLRLSRLAGYVRHTRK